MMVLSQLNWNDKLKSEDSEIDWSKNLQNQDLLDSPKSERCKQRPP